MSFRVLVGLVVAWLGVLPFNDFNASRALAQDDEESLSERIASRLIGRYELQGADPKVKMPPVLEFGNNGSLKYSAGPAAAKPGMAEGSFDVLDDGSLTLNCEEYFVDGGPGSMRVNGDAKDLTADKRYKRFALAGKYEYVRVEAKDSKLTPDRPAATTAKAIELKPGVLTAIALRGDAAPGCKDGAKFAAFGRPVINESGEIAFRAELDKDGVAGRSSDEGIFGGKPGAIGLWMRTGVEIPEGLPRGLRPEARQSVDAPKTTKNRYVEWIGKKSGAVTPPAGLREMLALSPDGTAIFTAVVAQPDGSRRRAILSASGSPAAFADSWQVVAVEGDAVPATRGGKPVLGDIRFVNLVEGDVRESEAWFLGGTKPQLVRATWSEYYVQPELKLPGLAAGESVGEVLDFVVNSSCAAVKARVTGPGVTEGNDEAVWFIQGNTTTLVLREGESAPDFTGSEPRLDSLAIIIVGKEGVLVRCKLRVGSASDDGALVLCQAKLKVVTRVWGKHSTHNQNLVVDRIECVDEIGQSMMASIIATQTTGGRSVTGLHVVSAGMPNVYEFATPLAERMKREKFPRVRNPLGLADRAAIPAQERGLLTMPALNGPRWTQLPIKAGDAAPGISGGTFAGFTTPLVNKTMMATVRTAVGARQALWFVDSKVLGSWATQLLVHEGQTVEVKPGDRRMVAQVTPAEEPAHRVVSRWVNREEVIVFRLGFTDGSEGVFAIKSLAKNLTTKGSGVLKDEAK